MQIISSFPPVKMRSIDLKQMVEVASILIKEVGFSVVAQKRCLIPTFHSLVIRYVPDGYIIGLQVIISSIL